VIPEPRQQSCERRAADLFLVRVRLHCITAALTGPLVPARCVMSVHAGTASVWTRSDLPQYRVIRFNMRQCSTTIWCMASQ
jgi:hypothetical protein